MRPGDVIIIYSDPEDGLSREGEARLISLIEDFGPLQLWKVKFDDGFVTERLIKPEK